MTRKQKSYKELETENTRGKKRYLERLVEDREAQQRVEDFLDHVDQPEESEHEQPRTHPFS
jgi:hypothetical protein